MALEAENVNVESLGRRQVPDDEPEAGGGQDRPEQQFYRREPPRGAAFGAASARGQGQAAFRFGEATSCAAGGTST